MARWFLAALGLSVVFAASASAAAEQTLRVAVPALPGALDPHKALTPIDRALVAEIFEGLVAIDADGRLAPGLAESWTVESGGTRYKFKLRPNLKWSDGRRLTADDIVEGFKRALDPLTQAPLAAALLPIKNAGAYQLGTLAPDQRLGISALSDSEIEITLEAPSARLLHLLAAPVSAPVPRHKMAAMGEAWAAPFLVVANGPFVPTPAGDVFALKRNANYSGAPAALDRVEFVRVESRDAAIDAIRRDEADVALGFDPEPTLGRGPAILAEDGGVAVYHWIINMTRPPFDDRNIRHALAMALDREGLIDELKLSGTRASFSVVPKGGAPGYEPPIASYGKLSQPEREIIAEVLLIDLDRATAPPIVLAVPEGALPAALATRARDAWRMLGFTVEIVTRSAADHADAVVAGAFSVAVPIGVELGPDPWPTLFPFSRAAGPLNLARYGELEFDEDLIPSDADTNSEYRLNGLRAAEDVLAEDQVAWPLFAYTPRLPVHRRIAGWRPNPTGHHPLKYMSIK